MRRRRSLTLAAAAASASALAVVAVGQAPASAAPADDMPMSCMALYDVTQSWTGGFVGEVTVMNHNTVPIKDWEATWTPGLGQKLWLAWDGRLRHHRDGTVSVHSVRSNRTIQPDSETTFVFVATSSEDIDFPIGSIGCTAH